MQLEYQLPPLTQQQKHAAAAMEVVRPAHQTAYFQNRHSLRMFLQRDLKRIGQSPEQLARTAHVDETELRRLLDTGQGSAQTIRRVFDSMNVTALVIPADSQDMR